MVDPSTEPRQPDALLTVRAAVVLLFALLIGGTAAVLAYLDGRSVPAAALVGGTALGAALALLHNTVIARR
jgi:hypothetical protein